MSNNLRYSISDEMLYGSIGGKSFSMKAYSGGGRGSTANMELCDLRHWSSQKKAPPAFSRSDRGGPLPPGHYLVNYYGVHEHLGRCAELSQTLTSLLYSDPFSSIGLSVTERSGFFIHGRGPKGSDGCIVPDKATDLRALLDAIESSPSPILLTVYSEGMNAEKIDAARFFGNVG
ncbi:MAG: hypothetical protein JSR42_00520 [Proteobacteria bacterium]|nr:hypothetical protein [Pseudomonadota bacterium]